MKYEIKYPIAFDKNDNYVHIKQATKQEKYFCPECKKEFIARQGQEKTWHFAVSIQRGLEKMTLF